jgi:predicted metal-binding protein
MTDDSRPVCVVCGEQPGERDMTTCDECDRPLCVHCARTWTSEDAICQDCYDKARESYDER